MAYYNFETDWELTAPIEKVFEVLSHPEKFEVWWPSVTRSTLVSEGEADGVGARARYTIKSPLLYTMTFDLKTIDLERPNRLRTVVRGDLVGTGTFLLEPTAAGTRVRFNWHVATTRKWMNAADVVAKPLLVWAHDRVMLEGCAAMSEHLGAELLWAKSGLAEGPTPLSAVQQ